MQEYFACLCIVDIYVVCCMHGSRIFYITWRPYIYSVRMQLGILYMVEGKVNDYHLHLPMSHIRTCMLVSITYGVSIAFYDFFIKKCCE